jgi:hypothetical protein
MRVFKIRDLHTGEVLERQGANALEILSAYEPEFERDDDGNLILYSRDTSGNDVPDPNGMPRAVTDEDGNVVLSPEKRFVTHGAEPRKWKEAHAAKVAEGAPESPAEDEELAPRKGRGRKRSAAR